jgi:hypothetical protein
MACVIGVSGCCSFMPSVANELIFPLAGGNQPRRHVRASGDVLDRETSSPRRSTAFARSAAASRAMTASPACSTRGSGRSNAAISSSSSCVTGPLRGDPGSSGEIVFGHSRPAKSRVEPYVVEPDVAAGTNGASRISAGQSGATPIMTSPQLPSFPQPMSCRGSVTCPTFPRRNAL